MNKIGHTKRYQIGHKQGCTNGHQNEDADNGVKLGWKKNVRKDTKQSEKWD